MKYLLAFLSVLQLSAFAQNKAGLTNQPDTSFSNYSAYLNAKKKYPEIRLVKDSVLPSIQDERNITYRTVGNTSLQIDVFRPKKIKGKRPAIIIIHGGGWRSGNRTQHYPLAERLAEKGFVCFTPAYRLSTEALYPAAVLDLKEAIRWVRAKAGKYHVDTTQIAVLGFSAGGQLATLLGTTGNNPIFTDPQSQLKKYSTKVNAIVDIDGTLAFIHPESGEGDDSKSTSAATYWFGYNKTEKPDLWRQAAALTYAGPQTPPTLFINSAVDRMHAGRTDYINDLKQGNVYTEVRAFPDTPHTFCLFEPWFTPTVNYITGFLDKIFPHNKNDRSE
ncbi:alpha/beta hydrolase [Mucilaginibacter sp. CSA2-8R]|uniref:alpha/beta hydrolase n=1 Tax=Mucilaginibacter sp. CSA2-8R TaxID=3141542 RepID=UPI00315D4312